MKALLSTWGGGREARRENPWCPRAAVTPTKEDSMSVRLCVLVLAIALASPLLGTVPVVSSSGSDTQVTQDNTAGSYLRHDGQTHATVTARSTGRRPQNEPTVPVNPRHPNILTARSNDHRPQIVNRDERAW